MLGCILAGGYEGFKANEEAVKACPSQTLLKGSLFKGFLGSTWGTLTV